MSQKALAPALQRWLTTQALKLLSDGELLDRFRRLGEEAAFAALLERHGPMVRGVCARLLRDPHDVDDAVQATFLVFVRQAAAIRKGEAVASWLHGVARRTALTARRQTKNRHHHERATPEADAPTLFPTEQAELRGCLDEEIGKLPAKYRAPVVLCYVEGRTVDQAAMDLAWPRGSVAGRLARARELLRSRLTRRGFAVAVVAGIEMAVVAEAATPLAQDLSRQIMQTAVIPAAPLSSVASSVVALVTGVEQTMRMTKFVWAGWCLALLALLGLLGATALAAFSSAQEKAGREEAARSGPPRAEQEWWLHVVRNGKHLALHLHGTPSRDLPAAPVERGIWSPDRKRQAYAQGVGNYWQVFEVELANGQTTQVTREALGARMPQYYPSGTLAYIIDRERSGKVMLGDLVLHGATPQVLVPREYITGYAFSPDGTRLAYSTFDTLTVRELATGKDQQFKVKDVNPQWSVSFSQPHWRPDGKALAVTFLFLGGVMVGPDGKGPNIPGEGYVALLPLDGGKISSLDVGKGMQLLGWCDPQGNPPRVEKAALPHVGKQTWYLIIHGGTKGLAVRDDGGEVRPVPSFSIGAGPGIARSPDGKRQASVDVVNKIMQVVERDLATDQQKSLSNPARHATKPKYHPEGYLAYLEEVQEEKPWPAPVNLMLVQDGQCRPFIKDKVILDYAFSPNGRFLAYCCPDEFAVHDLQAGTVQKFLRSQIDKEWSAAFSQLLWRSDSQAVAVQMANLHRLQHQNLPAVGEDHVVLLTLGGKPQAVKIEPQYALGLWLDAAELQKWEKDAPTRKK